MVHAKSDDEVLSVLATAKQDSNKAGLDKLLQFRTERWQENVKKINMSQ